MLAISLQFLNKCYACRTLNAQVILQPCKYSSRPKLKGCTCYFCLISFNFQVSTHSHSEQNSPSSPTVQTRPSRYFVVPDLMDSLQFINFKESISSSKLQNRCICCEIKCSQKVLPSSWRHRLACAPNDQASSFLDRSTLHDDFCCGEILLYIMVIITTY